MARPRALWLGAETARCLLFVPGFMTPVEAYRDLLEPLVSPDLQVGVLGVVPPGPRALLGRVTPQQEADAVAAVAAERLARGQQVWLGGHSRGGQVAWRAAESAEPPGSSWSTHDGQGPVRALRGDRRAPTFAVHPTVVRWAGPAAARRRRWPQAFAAADPRARLLVSTGRPRRHPGRQALTRGRLLCRGAADPAASGRRSPPCSPRPSRSEDADPLWLRHGSSLRSRNLRQDPA
jgi:hypothetical protein